MNDDAPGAAHELLTLKQLAEQLGLPESTVRYYRDTYIDQIPSVGTGRRRRYPPEAVAILRTIAEGYASGSSRSQVQVGLSRTSGAVPVINETPAPQHTLDHVTNLDLLAAILDGEREQRDALWQMAKEIVRLSEVLQDQDKVITDIADKAGVIVQGRLSAPKAAAPALAPGIAKPEPAAAPAPFVAPPAPSVAPTAPFVAPPAPKAAPVQAAPIPAPRATPEQSSVNALREELEKERALVERLREAKLQLEHRTAEAEAALTEQPGRKSVIRRLLGGE